MSESSESFAAPAVIFANIPAFTSGLAIEICSMLVSGFAAISSGVDSANAMLELINAAANNSVVIFFIIDLSFCLVFGVPLYVDICYFVAYVMLDARVSKKFRKLQNFF